MYWYEIYNFTEQYEGIYEILNQYGIRSITFDGLNKSNANRIANLRPMPSHFVIFARPTEMNDFLENVIHWYHLSVQTLREHFAFATASLIVIHFLFQAIQYNAVEQMNRWRLLYLDFVDNNIVQQLIIKYAELNSLTPSSEMCCVYLGSADSCTCHGKITVNFEIFCKILKFK